MNAWDRTGLQRCTEQLSALLLSLKKRPVIRYDKASMMATKLAAELKSSIKNQSTTGLFDFPQGEQISPILLILDRRADLITPLLSQWTYQALIHDPFGINNGSVDLSKYNYDTEDERANLLGTSTLHNIVPGQDKFVADHLNVIFGKVTEDLTRLLKEVQLKTSSCQKLESLAGIKQFLEDYPKMMKLKSIVAKHLSITAEINKHYTRERLLEVSELEQMIVTGYGDVNQLSEMLTSPNIRKTLKLKLALIYALQMTQRTGSNFDLLSYFSLLMRSGSFDANDIELVDFMVKFSKSETDLANIWTGSPPTATRVDQHIYTQHIPPLLSLVDALIRGKLRQESFPSLLLDPRDNASSQPREVIIFMIGGTAFEEACHLSRLSDLMPSVQLLIGGTAIHSSIR